jgi:hypothetical protein
MLGATGLPVITSRITLNGRPHRPREAPHPVTHKITSGRAAPARRQQNVRPNVNMDPGKT